LTGIDEWDFTARETQITEIGENGVILARFPGAADNSQNAISINLTKVNDETLLIDWSLISTRSTLRFDGLDDIALAGAEQLTLSD
jgi:hypothetical protein